MTVNLTMTLPHHVYRVYAADDTLLYVGCTAHVVKRMSAHAHKSAWWPLAARITYTTHPTLAAGRGAESKAIRTEHPICNIHERAVPPLVARTERDRYLEAHLADPDPKAGAA
jgi:predicted GIY-YIG superfamily endonuclease